MKQFFILFLTSSLIIAQKTEDKFFTSNEILDMDKFSNVGVIKNNFNYDSEILEMFLNSYKKPYLK